MRIDTNKSRPVKTTRRARCFAPYGTQHRARRVVLTGRGFSCQFVFGAMLRAVLGGGRDFWPVVVTFGRR
eukprot:2830926-Alexandrium_andersonii.AAC.1